MMLLDANVFVYAVGRPDRYRDPSRRIMRSLREGYHQYLTDAEVLQEILHVYGRRQRREQGLQLVETIIESEIQVIPIDVEVIAVAGRLLDRYLELDARDAVHAAAVQLHGLEGVVSADKGFDVIRGVTRFDPLEMFPD